LTPKGFALIELLIVVAIILIIAAISIPNLLRARIAAIRRVVGAYRQHGSDHLQLQLFDGRFCRRPIVSGWHELRSSEFQ